MLGVDVIAHPPVFKIFDLAQIAVGFRGGGQLVDPPDVRFVPEADSCTAAKTVPIRSIVGGNEQRACCPNWFMRRSFVTRHCFERVSGLLGGKLIGDHYVENSSCRRDCALRWHSLYNSVLA